MNTDILGISELNGQERANLIQMNIIPTTVGKNPLEEMERVQNAVLGCSLKNDRTISICFHGKSFNITVIQVYVPTNNAE